MAHDIVEKIKKEIAGYKDEAKWESAGYVTENGDGIVRIAGLKDTMSQEMLTIETADGPRRAVALNLEEDSVGALVLDDPGVIKSNDPVKRTEQVLSIEVGRELIGRVINSLGVPQDGQGPIFKGQAKRYFLENKAPSVLEREPVKTPLHTGIKAIDSMIPIGRGQRELIIGDRQTGKTAVALDAIINQKNDSGSDAAVGAGRKRPICVYVAIGQKESKIAKIVDLLKKEGAMDYTVVVAAGAADPASLIYLAPFAGCAVGEYFRDQGEDVLVVYDDLSKHAWSYRQISLLLRRPPGREAYPGDIFYLHSRLLERAAKLSKEKGGGSLTALPIVETQLGDVTAYIPTNIISITDGQIYLTSDLFYKGIRPAINVGLSVSRVGSAAQTKAMKKVAGKLRLSLAQFRELQAFVQFASDVDDVTKAKISHGQAVTEILKQNDLAPLPFERQVALFYATLNHYFDALPAADLSRLQNEYLEYLENFHGEEIFKALKEKEEMTPEIEEALKNATRHFLSNIEEKKN